jgi:hypothetical protein
MNCGIYQPLDDIRFAKFKAGMEHLHATVEQTGARVLHLTPPIYDKRPDQPGPAGDTDYDSVLEAYSTWLLSKRAAGWLVIDVHGPMKAMLASARAENPAAVFASDTVHPNDDGHWAMARGVLAGLGDSTAAAAATPAAFAALLPKVTARLHLLRDAYLAEMESFVAAVLDDQPTKVTGADGRWAVEAVVAINESLRTGLPVRCGAAEVQA